MFSRTLRRGAMPVLNRVMQSNRVVVSSANSMLFPAVRALSTSSVNSRLANFVQKEIDEAQYLIDEAPSLDEMSEYIGPFKVDNEKSSGSYFVLTHGNARVEFDAKDIRQSSDDDDATALEFELIISNPKLKQDMIFDCVAERSEGDYDFEEEDEEAERIASGASIELLIEAVTIVPHGKTAENDSYSPVFAELDDAVQQSFFDYAQEHGVDNNFSSGIMALAEAKEQTLYLSWLKEIQSFVKST